MVNHEKLTPTDLPTVSAQDCQRWAEENVCLVAQGFYLDVAQQIFIESRAVHHDVSIWALDQITSSSEAVLCMVAAVEDVGCSWNCDGEAFCCSLDFSILIPDVDGVPAADHFSRRLHFRITLQHFRTNPSPGDVQSF